MKKEKKQITKIRNNSYDIATLKRIAIFRPIQCGVSQMQTRKILNLLKGLTSKWTNFEKMKEKKIGRPFKF